MWKSQIISPSAWIYHAGDDSACPMKQNHKILQIQVQIQSEFFKLMIFGFDAPVTVHLNDEP